MNKIIISMDISHDDCLRYYQGSIKTVTATAEDGRIINFPANVIHKFINHQGIRGRFQLDFNNEGKLFKIVKL